MKDEEWESDWKRLVAERDAIRRRLCCAKDGLGDAARDPFGVKSMIREHPYVASAVGAGLGGIVAKLVYGAVTKKTAPRDGKAPEKSEFLSSVFATLKTVALDAVTPVLTRFVQEKIEDAIESDGCARESTPAAATTAD